MNFTNRLRQLVFAGVDALNGYPIKKQLQDIAKFNNQTNLQFLLAQREREISKLLIHAKGTVPYYKNLNTFNSLSDFPVIAKHLIQENFEDFKSPMFEKKKKVKVSTSGSTGIPFALYWNTDKKKRNSADTLYYLKQAGYTIGEKLVFIGATSNLGKEKTLKRKLQNFKYYNLKSINKTQINLIFKDLSNTTSPCTIVGYASNLEYIAQYIDQNKIEEFRNIKIKAVIAIAEALSNYTKAFFESYFGVKVLSRYSSQEVGILAQQTLSDNQDDFHVNWASYHFEILKLDSNEPTEKGKIGRIVVTDLFNYCMPLIRYDTGDLSCFAANEGLDSPFPRIARIQGRRSDAVYDTNGKQISSLFIDNQFYPYFDKIKQFQFIQSGLKDYTIKLNTFSNDCAFENELIAEVKSNFGKDANVTIELVQEIPLLSSGKRKKVKNDYYK